MTAALKLIEAISTIVVLAGMAQFLWRSYCSRQLLVPARVKGSQKYRRSQ